MSRSPRSGHKTRSLLAGVDLSKPIYKGYMYKQGHEHLAFNLRFFALYSAALVYYDNEDHFKRDVFRGTLEVSPMRDVDK